ncbi:hypothetical protein KBC70_00435 [Candidatus Woesebacteria bacterium]|nr:hypothetical protein [Candidatus Woesebacteria bacterium]
MLKYRLGTLILLFGLLCGLNFFLIYNLNQSIQVKKNQSRILAEIEDIDSFQPENSKEPYLVGSIESDVKLIDGRAAKLRRYLRSINSPLFDYSDLLVEEADKFGYDYRLLVAISLQESTGCKFIPENSYNCWGWGIYGDTVTRFASYDEAIRTVSAGIKKNYLDKGLITTEQIMKKYTPGSNGSWAWAVRYFFHRIENS